MKALVYVGPKSVQFQDVDDPVCGADASLIKVESVGICGSDIHAYLGHDERRPAPLILGHEVAGLVVEGAYAGKRVTVNPLVTCGACDPCLGGRSNLCPQREIISMMPRQGAFAEYVTLPSRNLIEVPEGFNISKAAMAEPIATAYHAVALGCQHSARCVREARAVVFGGGAIGLASALVLRSHGCQDITIMETNAGRRKVARLAGFDQVLDPTHGGSLRDSSSDIVIDAVGAIATRGGACQIVKAGGVIVHVGLLDSYDGIDVRRLTLQEIIFIGSYTYSMVDFRAAFQGLYTRTFGSLNWYEERPLSEGSAAFSDLINGRSQAAKIILKP